MKTLCCFAQAHGQQREGQKTGSVSFGTPGERRRQLSLRSRIDAQAGVRPARRLVGRRERTTPRPLAVWWRQRLGRGKHPATLAR